MTLDEISKLINRYEGEQRAELVDYYAQIVNEFLEDEKPINTPKIHLVVEVSKFLLADQRKSLMSKAINIKISQIRSYILEHFQEDFTTEKTHFSSISKWMHVLILEISKTFNPPLVSDEIAIEFHKKLCEELSLVFCSCEKFNSAGNQLLLDLKAYFDVFQNVIKDRKLLLEKVSKNFLPNKCLTNERIEELYANIKKRHIKQADEQTNK